MNMHVWPRLVNGVGILRGIEANIKTFRATSTAPARC